MEIKQLSWQQVLPIRHNVLWPDKPPLFCKVEGDDTAYHYGYFIAEELVCVASIFIDDDNVSISARLRKFATLEQYQGQGIGTQLIKHVINELKSLNVNYLWCDARITAIGFYQQFNMVEQGNQFQKSGVRYIQMRGEII